MAVAVFPPGGPGVKYPAANGITYIWDVDNNRWAVESVGKKGTATVVLADEAPQFPAPGDLWFCTKADNVGLFIYYFADAMMEGVWVDTMNADTIAFPPVKVSDDRPLNNNEGDLWYDTTDPNGGKLYIYVDGDFEQPSPSYLEHTELQDRVALLENTSEILNEYKCALTNSTGGSKPNEGEFKVANTNPNYVNKIRINGKDKYSNPLPIIHEGDGLEMLHEQNGKSHRFKVLTNEEGPYGDGDLEIGVNFIGGDDDSIQSGDNYLFRFHTPHTDVDEFAHLDKDQTFTGENTFDGETFFEDSITLKGKGVADFDELHSKIISKSPPGWQPQDEPFGIHIDIGTRNSFKNQFTIGGRDNRDVCVSIFDDGSGGVVRATSKLQSDDALFVSGESDFKDHVKIYGVEGTDQNTVVGGETYIVSSANLSQSGAFVKWREVGCSSPSVGHVFTATNDGTDTLVGTDTVRTYTGDKNLSLSGDISCTGVLMADAVEGHEMYMSGYSTLDGGILTAGNIWIHQGGQGATGVRNALVVNQEIDKGAGQTGSIARFQQNGTDVIKITMDGNLDMTNNDVINVGEVDATDLTITGDADIQGDTTLQSVELNGTLTVASGGAIDMENATIFNNSPVPKSWFTKVLKEFAGEFKTIYIDENNNGTSDPAINIKASTGGSSILIKDTNNATRFSVNVQQGYAFGGSSAAPWIAAYDHHFTTKKYVDDAVAAAGGGASYGYQFTYTNLKTNMGTGKFTSQNESGTFRLYISETTADGVTWYNNADMALKALDFESAGGPGPMYTIRDVNDNSKIMRQGYLKAIQYQGNQFVAVFDGASQINVGSMTIGGNYNITIGGLF